MLKELTVKFDEAFENGEVLSRGGYHKPGNNGHWLPNCGCKLTTKKGAYRDMSIKMDSVIIHYYHQSPVVVEGPRNLYRISSCGWRTSTTKERINRYLPSGYRVFQKDFNWYLNTPKKTIDFYDGMVIEA